MDNWSKDNLPNIEPQSYPVLGDFIPIIDEWLENDRKIPRKQRHTIRRIYSRLCDEKGNVENKVGYGRRNTLVPVPTITDFDEFNESLWEWCEKDAERNHYKHNVPIQSLWEEEKEEFLALPEYPYQIFRYEALRVNKYGFATIDTNKYGLPPSLCGETVQAKIFFDHIEFYHDHRLVGEYKRSYGTNEECMNWTYYVSTLCKKPGAAPHTRFFHAIPEQWKQHISSTAGAERKNALHLLKEIVTDEIEQYANAFKKVSENYEELLKDDPGDPERIGGWFFYTQKK